MPTSTPTEQPLRSTSEQTIGVIGHPNSGKTELIKKILKHDTTPWTKEEIVDCWCGWEY